MAVPFDDDDWERVKLGRFSDADERLVHRVMGPWFLKPRRSRFSSRPKGLSKQPKSRERQLQVLMSRGNTVALGLNYASRKQAMVKVGFCPKSRRVAMRQTLYVTRRRPEDIKDTQYKALPVWDGFGLPVEDEDISSITEKWDLPAEEDNLSKKARTLLVQGEVNAFNALGGRERLRNILTWHFILSIEENEEALYKPFRAAVRATVDAALTAEGHPALWAIHTDTDHMHAHVIVKALSDFGGRIHSDIRGDYLHVLRETFAGKLRLVGLDYEATRRIDRRSVREDIMAGRIPLHDEVKPWQGGGATLNSIGHLRHWPHVYGQTALASTKRIEAIRQGVKDATNSLSGSDKALHAAKLLKAHLDQAPAQTSWWGLFWPRKRKQAQKENLSRSEAELLEHLERMFHDPRQALESYRLMASEGQYRNEKGKRESPNRSLAIWTLQNRPEQFGFVKSGAFQNDDFKPLRRLLKQVRLWAPEHLPQLGQNDNTYREAIWRTQAAKGREGVLSELSTLRARIDGVWPDARLSRAISQAIRQTRRIELDKLPANQNEFQGGSESQAGTTSKKRVVREPASREPKQKPIRREPPSPVNSTPIMHRKKRSQKSKGRER